MNRIELGSSLSINMPGQDYVKINPIDPLDRIIQYMPKALEQRLISVNVTHSNRMGDLLIKPLASLITQKRGTAKEFEANYPSDLLAWIKAEAYKYKTVAAAIKLVPSNVKQADEFMTIASAAMPLIKAISVSYDPTTGEGFKKVAEVLRTSSLLQEEDNGVPAKRVVTQVFFPDQGSYQIPEGGKIPDIMVRLMSESSVPYGRSERSRHLDMLHAVNHAVRELLESDSPQAQAAGLAVGMLLDSYLVALQPGSTVIAGLNVDMDTRASSASLEMIRRISDSLGTLLISSYLSPHFIEFQDIHHNLTNLVSFVNKYVPDNHVRYMNLYQIKDMMDILAQFTPDYFVQMREAAGAGKRESISNFTGENVDVMPLLFNKYVKFDIQDGSPVTEITGPLPKALRLPKLKGSVTTVQFYQMLNTITGALYQSLETLTSFNVVMNHFFQDADRSLIPTSVVAREQVNGSPVLTYAYADPFDHPALVAIKKYEELTKEEKEEKSDAMSTNPSGKGWVLRSFVNRIYNLPHIIKSLLSGMTVRWVFDTKVPLHANLAETLSERFAMMPIPYCYADYTDKLPIKSTLTNFIDLVGPATAFTTRYSFFEDITEVITDGYNMEHTRHIINSLMPYFIIEAGGTDKAWTDSVLMDASTYMIWGWPANYINELEGKKGEMDTVEDTSTLIVSRGYGAARTLKFTVRSVFPQPTNLMMIRDTNFKQTHQLVQVSKDWFDAVIPRKLLVEVSKTAANSQTFDIYSILNSSSEVKKEIKRLLTKVGTLTNYSYYPQLAAVPQLTATLTKNFMSAFSLTASDIIALTGSKLRVIEDPDGFIQFYVVSNVDPVIVLAEDELSGTIDAPAPVTVSTIEKGKTEDQGAAGIESNEVAEKIDAPAAQIQAGDIDSRQNPEQGSPSSTDDNIANLDKVLSGTQLKEQNLELKNNNLNGDLETEEFIDEDGKTKRRKKGAKLADSSDDTPTQE